MGKGKKKRKIDQVSHLTNLTGLGGLGDGHASSSMDDCMAEMMQQQQPAADVQQNPKQRAVDKKQPSTSSSRRIHQPSWIRQSSCMNPEEIGTWNQSFLQWAADHHYTPGLLPNIDEEIARNFKVKELSSLLLKSFKDIDLRMPVFERWLLDSKLEENQSTSERDPVLPLTASPDSNASQRLLSEIMACGSGKDGKTNKRISREDAEKVIDELCRKTSVSCQELLAQRDRYRRQSPLKKGDRIQIETDCQSPSDVVTILYCRKKWKKPFCFKINRAHYQRLKVRFVDVHDSAKKNGSSPGEELPWPPKSLATTDSSSEQIVERSFHVVVLALLLRYSALSGGQLLEDLRGGGMQGAIHSSVFDALRTNLGCGDGTQDSWLEGFASPFNATLPRFASAFPDLDWHFGSVGSFSDCSFQWNSHGNPAGEFCEANPPFTPGVMESMANHMSNALAEADGNERALSFVVVVPSASKARKKASTEGKMDDESVVKQAASRSFQDMVTSKYCATHLRLKAREHGYVEGAQHLRPTMYKQSSYDTSVIILQSPKARELEGERASTLERDIRNAFASRHETELKKRKVDSY
ncbi:MAG: hypothetical protein SGILL_002156 [Bacillariaceae sp.]